MEEEEYIVESETASRVYLALSISSGAGAAWQLLEGNTAVASTLAGTSAFTAIMAYKPELDGYDEIEQQETESFIEEYRDRMEMDGSISDEEWDEVVRKYGLDEDDDYL